MWIYRAVDRFNVGDLVAWPGPGGSNTGTVFGKSYGNTWIVIPTPATANTLALGLRAGVLIVNSLLEFIAPASKNESRYMIEDSGLELAMIQLDS